MKITIYELLGMVKDGKQPEHIKYRDEEWWWGYDTYTYFADLERTPDAQTNMFTRYVINYCLDDEVEILEEEKKIPEKLDLYEDLQDILNSADESVVLNAIHKCLTCEKIKINEIIDYLKSKGE